MSAAETGELTSPSVLDQDADRTTGGVGGMFAHDVIDELMKMRGDDWTDARCQDGWGTLTDLFFSDQLPDIARAKAICGSCTRRDACLDGAIARREHVGCLGRPAVCQRPDPGPEAQAGPAGQDSPARHSPHRLMRHRA